ncbi:MAG: histidine phosphatase family protein [Candidatus Promineifilaceae bacterium]
MSHLILIRHSNSRIQTDRPANQWRLSDLGKERARGLSPILAQYNPTTLFSSDEPKAIETATIAAEVLNVTNVIVEDLHEHERINVGWTNEEQFEFQVSEFFARQDELVFGEETAVQARSRFNNAVRNLLLYHPEDTVAVVSHGSVMTLFVSSWNEVDPFQFWHSLEMPSVVTMSRQTFMLEAVLSVDTSQKSELSTI